MLYTFNLVTSFSMQYRLIAVLILLVTPSSQFEKGIEKTIRRYPHNQELMYKVTSKDYEKYYESMYKWRLLWKS